MNLVTAFAQELEALINPGSAFRIARQVYSRPELAEKLSGAPRGSKAYKAALRSVERYETTGKQRRTPSEATKSRLAEILKQDEAVINDVSKALVLDVSGEFVASQTRRRRSVEVNLPPDMAALAMREAREGRNDAVYQTVFTAYGFIPDAVNGMQVRIR